MKIKLNINNKDYNIEVNESEMLLVTLRRLGFKSVRQGCDTSSCGICSVLCDGKIVLSCSALTVRHAGKKIVTAEGLQNEIMAYAKFAAAEGSEQCGFCSSGLVMNIIAMKNETTDINDTFIKEFLVNNLCRCTGYESQMRAIKAYLMHTNGAQI